MRIDLKKVLLTGTAIVAVAGFGSHKALAADYTLAGNATWAGAGTHGGTSITDAQAGQTVDLNDFTLTVTNNQTADDGSGLNAFSVGDITDSGAGTGTVSVVQNAIGSALVTTISSVTATAGLSLSNNDAANADTTLVISNTLSLGGNLTISNGETDATSDVNMTVDRDANITGNVVVTSGTFAGADSNLTFNGNATFGSMTLADNGGSSTVTFSSTGAQVVTGAIDGNNANEGSIAISNTAGVTFADDLGVTSNALDTISLGASSIAEFQGSVTAATISMGADSTMTFSSAGAIVDANVSGTTGGETINLSSATTFGQSGNAIAMGDGNDTITVSNGVSFISADTLAGGAGTDTVTVDDTLTINSSVTGFEAFNVADTKTLTFTNDVTGGTVTLGDGSAFFVSGGSVTSGVASDATGADVQNFTLTAGTMSGDVDLGAGNDAVTFTSGTMSGNLSLGTGDDTLALNGANLTGNVDGGGGTDTATLGADLTTDSTITNVELIDLAGNTLTVQGDITNGGATYGAAGINVNGGTLEFDSSGSFDGSIYGAGLMDVGADAGGGTYSFAGAVDDVALTVTSGTLSTNGSAWGANGALGAINVAAGATFNVNDNVTNTGSDTTVAGTMKLGAGSTLATDNLDVNATGTLKIVVDSTASFGNATTTADVNLAAGSTLSVVVGTGNLNDGDELLIVNGAAQVNAGGGQAAAAVTDNSILWSFQVADGSDALITGSADNKDLYLKVSAENTIASLATTTNNAAVGTVLQSLSGTSNTQLLTLVTAMNSAGSAAALNTVLEQAQPTIDGSSMNASLVVMNNTFSLMDDRLDFLRGNHFSAHGRDLDRYTGMATGNVAHGVRGWGQAFGSTGKQGTRNNIKGYDYDTGGAAFGMDSENLGDDTVVGAAFSYANTDANSDNASHTNTNTDSYQFSLYGNHNFDNDIYLQGMAAYTLNKVHTDRQVAGMIAHGQFDANQYTMRAEVGREYDYRGTTLTPHLIGHWTHYDPDSYTETGAGGAGLLVNQNSVDIAELGVGVDASWLYQNVDGTYFLPKLKASYRYDLADDRLQMTSNFIGGGNAFTTNGTDPQQSTLDLGAGFTYYTTDNWQLTAEYNYEWKEDFDAHSGMMRASYDF